MLLLHFLSIFSISVPASIKISADICPCEIDSTICNVGCCCDSKCPDYSASNSSCYPDTPTEFIPACPSTAFHTSTALTTWLIDELFCIKIDNRDTLYTTYANSSNVTQVTVNPTPTATPAPKNLYKTPIFTSNGSYLYLPASSEVSECLYENPTLFLKPYEAKSCYTRPAISSYNGTSILSYPGSSTTVSISVDSSLASGTYFSELILTIVYSTSDSKNPIESATITGSSSSSNSGFVYVSVRFQTSSSITYRSGEVGYFPGKPVWGAQYTSSSDSIVYTTSPRGSFPIDFGLTCGSSSYIPLLFGEDAVGGCQIPSTGWTSSTASSYNLLSAIAYASPENLSDWVQISGDGCTSMSATGYIYVERYAIYIDRFSNTDQPQNQIISAFRECLTDNSLPTGETSRYIISFSFFNISSQTTTRYLPEFPDWLPSLPSDFFYPFGNGVEAAALPIARPSAILLILLVIIGCYFF